MRTTVRIDDDLLAELKQRANGAPLTTVLNETLRRGLMADDDAKLRKVKNFRQRTVSLGKPLIDINKALSILNEQDDIEMLRKMGLLKDPENGRDAG